MYRLIPLTLAIAAALPAQPLDADVSPGDRAWIAAQIYSSIQRHFAHWEGVPGLDFEKRFREYVDEAMRAKDRREFDLATMALFGALGNGHTGFGDAWLARTHSQPLGFSLRRIGVEWVVTASHLADTAPGDVIAAIDGLPMEQFFERMAPLLEGSSRRAKENVLDAKPFLWPDKFRITLASGAQVSVDRAAQKLGSRRTFPGPKAAVPDTTADLKISSFGDPASEKAAVEFVRKNSAKPTLIVDVRGNGGGSTPSELIRALLDRPWQELRTLSPLRLAFADATNQTRRAIAGLPLSDHAHGYMDALGDFDRAQLLMPGARHEPAPDAYRGKLIVLIDSECASACEDFVQPLKSSGRATLLGETTNGSSGQPAYHLFPNGMSFRVSSKRYYFPDGRLFEGVGIEPDRKIAPSLEDLKHGRDPALEAAVALLHQP